MDNFKVKDFMIPISEYATVEIGTPLIDALKVLERAQTAYTESKYQHRAIIVLDTDGKVVGKISQMRALKAMEPKVDFDVELKNMKRFKFSDSYIAHLQESYRSRGKIFTPANLEAAAAQKVEEFMQTPKPGEYVSGDCSLDVAVHRLVAGTHLSLLVTENEKIVGMLRIADVFAAAFGQMMALET